MITVLYVSLIYYQIEILPDILPDIMYRNLSRDKEISFMETKLKRCPDKIKLKVKFIPLSVGDIEHMMAISRIQTTIEHEKGLKHIPEKTKIEKRKEIGVKPTTLKQKMEAYNEFSKFVTEIFENTVSTELYKDKKYEKYSDVDTTLRINECVSIGPGDVYDIKNAMVPLLRKSQEILRKKGVFIDFYMNIDEHRKIFHKK